ncbi:MAG: ABC transporter substrate-binding protein [Lachnospiraceae bacterium]|nr:ABC transporter substrate-binding protein [Lachnospiraceae bacterium]
MKKRLLSLMTVAALGVTMLAGCGAAGSKGGSGSTGSAGGADTFYIGGIGPTTGAAAIYGSCVMNAAQIAVDEINEAGGINGYQVAYRFEDDVHDPEKSVNAYNSLKDWGMQVLMGTVTTSPCIAVSTESSADHMFEITPSASSTDVIDNNDNVYQVCFTDPNQGTASADYIADSLDGVSKVAVIYNSADVYSQGIHDTFISESEAKGLVVVSDTAFTDDTKTDFSTQLQKAQENGAELVFLPIYYQEASIILQQAKDMGYAPTFFGVDGMDGILTLEGFDTSLAEGVMLLTPFSADADDEKTQNFVAKYQEAYGDVPNQFGADAYDAIYIIKAALEEAGATPDMSASDICDAVLPVMSDITFEGGITGDSMQWDENGAVNKAPKAVVIENGAYKAMD